MPLACSSSRRADLKVAWRQDGLGVDWLRREGGGAGICGNGEKVVQRARWHGGLAMLVDDDAGD